MIIGSNLVDPPVSPATRISRARAPPLQAHQNLTRGRVIIINMSYKAPIAAKPSKAIFDPFNSSATGHQRAENKLSGSTSWRDSRHRKLHQQFSSGVGGGKRVSDSVGAGSKDFGRDGRTENGGFEKGAKGLRTGGQQSLWATNLIIKKESEERPSKRIKTDESPRSTKVVNPYTPFRREDGKIRETSWTSPSDLLEPIDPLPSSEGSQTSNPQMEDKPEEKPTNTPQIFSSLNFYINGSTYPLSDHALKHMISSHGGNMSIALGRRTVTHVIIGKPNGGRGSGGSGGGLAGSKIQKEITSMRGKGIKFISAEWVSESIKAGKRLPESRFVGISTAPKGVSGIQSMFAAVGKK